jgi:hypothetical protein
MNAFKERVHPHHVESYMGTDIWFNPINEKYYAPHCEHTKYDASLKEVKKWIERYKN